MNKTELVKKVAAENELSQKQAAAVVDSVLNAVVDTVAAGEPVALLGFGTFSVKHRDARQGRNPATGEAMEFAASNTPVFKAARRSRKRSTDNPRSPHTQRERAAAGRLFFMPGRT